MTANNPWDFFRKAILAALDTQDVVRVSRVVCNLKTTEAWPWCWVRIVGDLMPSEKFDADGDVETEDTVKFYVVIGARSKTDTEATGSLDDAINSAVHPVRAALHAPSIVPRSYDFEDCLVSIKSVTVDEAQGLFDDRETVGTVALIGSLRYSIAWK